MSSNNRARSRAIRGRMAASGEKYTTAAAAVARPPRPANHLRAVCFGCRKDIAAGNGVIHVSYDEIERVERARAAAEEQRLAKASSEGGTRVAADLVTAKELLAASMAAEWQVHCDDCNPHNADGCGACYWFEVERCSTWAQLVEWTAQLAEKSWLPATNWMSFIR
ncbi:hypothetical protein GCM10010399_08440 [Dactylosporangium fulvum]|uniref:Uncharacterized protein n=1 Tax=Dactylosporangium fulvum TaxID=53359 RepID=A0ABY5WCR7_9ACTN|nr:hypothetical protein [Dactylosporangium fulvum]UWP86518.1 hypothetical protein Dfulv_20660 [Dactylosporangium fulvum]